MQYGRAAAAPQGDARSNFRLARELALRMGLTDPVFRMSEADALGELFRGASGPAAEPDLNTVRSGRPLRYAAPGAQEFCTPSGRLEFYSEQLAASGLAPMPDWRPDPEEERDRARWPLRLLTAPGYFQAHTAYSGVDFLRRREGKPCCILHPDEAAQRGLADGMQVRLHNERGAVGLVLRVSDEVLPGVVLVPGQRPDGETLSGTINLLCSDRYTDLGDGATYQSTFLDIEPIGDRGA
jgi:anaerobic selenocysteine-containing dehydrogenase